MFLSVLGAVLDPGLVRQIFHTLLGKGGADQVGREPLQGSLLPGQNTRPAVDVEAGVAPAVHDPDGLRGDPALVQKYPQEPVAEDPLQRLHGESGSDPEQALAVECAVRGQDVQVGVKPFRELPEGLRGHNGPGFRVCLGDRGPDDGP